MGPMEAQRSPMKLVADATNGDHDSFEVFFAAGWDRLFRALLLMTGSKQEAEDLAQGAFLKVLERWDSLDHDASVEGYLFRTAMNAYRSLYRRSLLTAKRALAPHPANDDPFERVAGRAEAVRLLLS